MKEFLCFPCKRAVSLRIDGSCSECGSGQVERIASSAGPVHEMTGIEAEQRHASRWRNVLEMPESARFILQ